MVSSSLGSGWFIRKITLLLYLTPGGLTLKFVFVWEVWGVTTKDSLTTFYGGSSPWCNSRQLPPIFYSNFIATRLTDRTSSFQHDVMAAFPKALS